MDVQKMPQRAVGTLSFRNSVTGIARAISNGERKVIDGWNALPAVSWTTLPLLPPGGRRPSPQGRARGRFGGVRTARTFPSSQRTTHL